MRPGTSSRASPWILPSARRRRRESSCMSTQATAGIRLHAAAEVVAAQHEDVGVLHGNDVGRTRLLVDQRQLAEMFARSEHAENDFAPVLADQHDLDPAITDDEQGISRVVLEQNDAALRIALLARQLCEALQLGVIELGEERNCPQEVGDLHLSECSERGLVRRRPNGRLRLE